MLDAVSVGACSARSSSRLLSPSSPPSSVRPTPIARLFSSLPWLREGGRGHGACVDVSGRGGRIRTIMPSITNVNSQDGSLSHWLRCRRRRSLAPFSVLVEEGTRGSCSRGSCTTQRRLKDRPRRSAGLARSPSSFFFFFFPSFPSSPTVLLALINWINKIHQRGEYHRN